MTRAVPASTMVELTYVDARRRSIDPGMTLDERRAALGLLGLIRGRGVGPERAAQLDGQVLAEQLSLQIGAGSA